MRKQILKTASIVAVGIILSATPVFAKTQVNVIVVDGKNTSSTSDDTYYHLKVTKGKKLSNKHKSNFNSKTQNNDED